MIYKGQSVKPKSGDLLKWADGAGEWFGFITQISGNGHTKVVKFQFNDGSTKELAATSCNHFNIVSRAK